MNSIKMEFCRLCQLGEGKFPIDCNKLTIKISEITRIEVNDELKMFLPMCICITCLDKITDIYNFVQKVQEIDRDLRITVKSQLIRPVENIISASNNISDVNVSQDIIVSLEKTTLKEDLPALPSGFMCQICSKYFTRSSKYNTHKKTHHLELHCNKCNNLLPSESDVKTHKCEYENGKGNETKLKKVFKRKSSRKSKPKIKIKSDDCSAIPLNDDIFHCSQCKEAFNNKNKLRVHIKTHTKFTCAQENCYKELPSAYSLKIHQLHHLGKRPFLCVTCGKGFLTKNSLTCHEKIHSEVKAYRCELCNIGFTVRSNLRAHEKKYHEGVRFYCSQCTKEFLTKSSLDRHEKIHAGVKEFQCGNCAAAFYTSKELAKHQRYHQGLRLYKCEECFKTFFERHHLISHQRSHSGERPYVCKIPGCGKSFAESQKLKRHHTAKHNTIG